MVPKLKLKAFIKRLLMNQVEFEHVADRAVRISELIEEIIQLDELLSLHRAYHANGIEANQYRARRLTFLEELNQLLTNHSMKMVLEEKAA